MQITVEVKLPVLEGFRYTGEFRCPRRNEYYATRVGNRWVACQAPHTFTRNQRHILEMSRWRARYGDFYYFAASDGHIISTKELGTTRNKEHFDMGNYWQTSYDARAFMYEVQDLALARQSIYAGSVNE
jgi:hypothetical protein